MLATGAALYVAGHLAFRLRMLGTLANRRIVAIAALAVSVVVTSGAPSLVSLAGVVAVLALLSLPRPLAASVPSPVSACP